MTEHTWPSLPTLMPYVGMRFLHSRVLNGNYQPALYIVTKVAQGTVWYKQPDERKAKQCCAIETFHKYCGEIMQ